MSEYMNIETVTNPLQEEGQSVEGIVWGTEKAKEKDDETGKSLDTFYDRYLVILSDDGRFCKFSLNRFVRSDFEIFGENNVEDYLKIPKKERKVKVVCTQSKTEETYPHIKFHFPKEQVQKILKG
jgi:hypothetical protein